METKIIKNYARKLKRLILILILWPLISTFSSAQNFSPDIYYRIVAKHSGKVLDVNMGKGNQANVVQQTWHGGDNQRWKIESVGSGYFRITAKHSGKVLDVNLGKDNQANVVQHSWHGGNNQRWKFIPEGNGYYRIQAKHSGRVLDVVWKELADQANVVQHDWHAGDNQRWKIEALSDVVNPDQGTIFRPGAYYRIVAKHSGKVLDVNLGKGNQANVVQHGWHGGDNQRWKFVSEGNGYYRIVAKHSGRVLDVVWKELGNQANVVQNDWHSGDNQRWKIEGLGDGYYRILAKHSGKALDVNMGKGDQANVVQHAWHGGENQRWKFELVE